MAGQHDLGTGRTGVAAKSRATRLTVSAGFELNGTGVRYAGDCWKQAGHHDLLATLTADCKVQPPRPVQCIVV